MPEAQKSQEPKKSTGIRKWLVGGTLTAIAAGVFFVGAPHFRDTAPGNDNGAVTQTVTQQSGKKGPTVEQAGDIYPAVTKDQKMLRITMEITERERGNLNREHFKASLKNYATLHLMTEVRKYDLADIPANIAKIQQDVARDIENSMPVASNGGQLITAKAGVNFDGPVIGKVEDATNGRVVYSAGAMKNALSRFGF